MYNTVWFDVIVLQHGSRDIEFSSKTEKEATTKMNELFKSGHITYVVRNTVQLNGVVKKHLLDPYGNYVPYEVEWKETPTIQTKKPKKHKNVRDIKKEYHF